MLITKSREECWKLHYVYFIDRFAMVVYNTTEEVKKFLATLKIFDKTCISYQEIAKKRKGMVGFPKCLET